MEFSGLDPRKHSIVSIGAVDFENPSRQFYKECRIWHGAEIVPESLATTELASLIKINFTSLKIGTSTPAIFSDSVST